MAKNTPAQQLFDLLVSRDFDPEMLDSAGKTAPDPAEAELFNFDFRAESGKDYGTVVILLGDDKNLEVYFGDNVGRTMEGEDKDNWFEFLKQMKHFAVKNFMEFSPKNINRLRYSMMTQAAVKESLFESWSGTRTQSWNGRPTEARLMIRHKRPLGETDARYRYVESLFVETDEGERYKLPFTKLSGGRAMVEHVRQGGKPYDMRGQHIVSMVEEINVLSRFRRANQGRLLEGDTAELVEQANHYYENLQRNIKNLSTRNGYKTYFEAWNPADITEEEVVVEGLKHLFVTQSIDDRIESALPLLARIQQQGTAMKEANIFEAWAQRLTEGTWQLPDTPEKQSQLIELMQQDLPVGADATDVTEQLYDLLGDDHLFDQLEALAERDANADARQVIYDRMSELSDHPEVRRVIEQLQVDDQAEMNPPEATPADLGSSEMDDAEHVPGAQGNINRLAESRMLDEDGSTLEHILNRFKYEVRHFEQGGDLDKHLYHALEDYYRDLGEIPYPILNGDEGDPMEWVAQNLESHLRGGGIVNGTDWGAEDRGLERESVMHGDYAEESADPLAKILKIAGVPAGKREAPVYNHSTMEEEETDEAVGSHNGKPTVEYRGIFYVNQPDGSWSSLRGDHVAEPAVKQVLDKMHTANEAIIDPNSTVAIHDPEGERFAEPKADADVNVAAKWADIAHAGDVGPQPGVHAWAAGYPNTNNKNIDIKGNMTSATPTPTPTPGGVKQQPAKDMGKADVIDVEEGDDINAKFANPQDQYGNPAKNSLGQTADDIRAQAGLERVKQAAGLRPTLTPTGPYDTKKLGGPDMQPALAKEDTSPLAGQYGHSGKMKEVGKETSFLDRLKELSGMIRN